MLCIAVQQYVLIKTVCKRYCSTIAVSQGLKNMIDFRLACFNWQRIWHSHLSSPFFCSFFLNLALVIPQIFQFPSLYVSASTRRDLKLRNYFSLSLFTTQKYLSYWFIWLFYQLLHECKPNSKYISDISMNKMLIPHDIVVYLLLDHSLLWCYIFSPIYKPIANLCFMAMNMGM